MYYSSFFAIFAKGIDFMRKIITTIILCVAFLSAIAPTCVMADESTRQMVEEVISGNQDYLVFASIIEKGTSAYEVQVYEEIGAKQSSTASDGESASKLDQRINVVGFDNYMYYENYDQRPKKGDNVLLSLQFNGNSYSIKNGAYKVDFTSREQFSFLVPEALNGSEEALELSALYVYVKSNAEVKELSIKDGAIYGKDANGAEEKKEIQGGLIFLDEYGDTTEKPPAVEMYTNTERNNESSNKWKFAAFIIVAGAIAGVFVVKLFSKYEKKVD